jgi:hypothetical protein
MTKTAKSSQASSTALTSSAPFFEKKGSEAKPAPSFFAYQPGIQTKLAIGKSDDAFEQEAEQVAEKVQAKLAIGAPDDPYETEADQMADKVVNQMQAGVSVQAKKEPTQRGREREEGDYIFLKPEVVQRLGEDIDGNGSRESIVAAARSMVGKIEAKRAEGSQRVGAKYLLDIFHLAAPGVWDDSVVQTAGAGLPSWCGIFTVWAHKKAGKDIGTWQIGKGVSAFGTIQQTTTPQAGDIGYIDQPYQHHCIVVRIDGNNVHSIDGNSGWYSEVKESIRPMSAYSGFFTAFGPGSSVQRKKIQRKGKGESASVPTTLEQSISSSKGKGESLPGNVQQSIGPVMGADFSDVRIHADQNAADMSNALDAQAFTYGKDIYFNKNKYNPASKDGQHLLAHELTHTIQQGASAQRKNIVQKSGNTETSDEINETEFNKYAPSDKKGSIKKAGKTFTLRVVNLPIKGYADQSLIDGNKPFQRMREERKTKQGDVWRSQIIGSIKKSLEAVLPDPSLKNENLVLELKSNPQVKVVGTFNQIAEEIRVPFWSKEGQPVIHEIEHRVDFQIIGNRAGVVDNMQNILLLDRRTNNYYGKNVKKDIQAHIQSILDHYKKKFKSMPNAAKAMADKDYEIFFDSFLYEKVAPLGLIVKEFLDDPRNPFNPINKKNIDVRKFEIPKGHFILKTSAERAGYLLPYKAKSVVLGGFRVTTEGDEENHRLISLKLEPATTKKGGKTILEKDIAALNFDPATEIQKPQTDIYVISNQALAVKLKDLVGIKGLSPVLIKSADIDSGLNLQVHGTVLHNVQFLADNNIEVGFNISGSSVSVYANISKDNIKNFPKPFQITYSSLSLIAGTEGVVVEGDLGFEIKELGKGSLTALAGTIGFAISGDFEIDNKKFKGSRISFKYQKNEWAIKGNLKVPERDLITGVKKADLVIEYKEKKINANGSADLDVPGVDNVKLSAEFKDNGSFTITGSSELKQMPGIKSGAKVEVTVTKPEGSDEYSLAINGKVAPNLPKVPNLNPEMIVSYKDGMFKAECKAEFKSGGGGMFGGSVTVGVTNATVEHGVIQAGKVGKEISVYGQGELDFYPIPSVKATIRVKVNPKGEALFSAELDLLAKPFKEVKPKPLELLKVSKDVPLAGVPLLTLNIRIGMNASLYARWDPLTLKMKGKITDKTYDELTSGKVDAALSVEADTNATVGLEVAISVGGSATLGVVIAGAELMGNVKLEANGVLSGKIDASWTGEKGLKLKKADAKANIRLDLIPGLAGRAFVDLDLLISKQNIWERVHKIAEGNAINLYQLSVTLPFEFDENNELKPFEIGKIKFDPPLNKETAQKHGENAADPEKKAKPVPFKVETVEDKIRQEVSANMRRQRKKASIDLYTYGSNLREHMLKSKNPELRNVVLKAVEDELRSIELEEFTAFRAEVLSSNESTQTKLNRIDAFEKDHGTVDKKDLNTLREEARGGGTPGPVQPKLLPGTQSTQGFVVPDDFSERMQRAKPNGIPLPLDVKAEMNTQFGADFSQVRVHYDDEAITLAREVNAQAFTHENHIFFNNGKYEPASSEGKKLLAHELTHVLQQGHGEPVKRIAEKDATGTRFTGNYIFDAGRDGLSSSFFNMAKRFVRDGGLSDAEIRALRKNAIGRNGSVLHAELLLMAAMRNPANVALMQAHRGGELILAMSNILQADKDYVINFDRATVPPEIAHPNLRLLIATLGLSGETVDEARTAMDRAAEQYILQVAGRQFLDQATKLTVSASFTNPVVPLYEIVEAMVNAAADSTPGDQVMAGSVYLVARRFRHSTASQILNGTIKVDAVIPSVYRRLLGSGEAGYSYSTDQDIRKANVLYAPTDIDIFQLADRALIIHELTHAEDDLSRSTEQQVDSLDLESRAYVAQGRHMLEEILSSAPAPGFVSSASGYVNLGPLYYWSMLLATKRDTARYETTFLNVCVSAPASKTQASVRTDLALTEVAINARIRAALLALRTPAGQALYTQGNTRLGGASGHYFR